MFRVYDASGSKDKRLGKILTPVDISVDNLIGLARHEVMGDLRCFHLIRR